MFLDGFDKIDSHLLDILVQDNITSFQMFQSTLHGKSAYLSSRSLAIQVPFCSLINEPTFVGHLEFSEFSE